MNSDTNVPIRHTQRLAWPGSTPAGTLETDLDTLLTVWMRPSKGGDLDAERARALGGTPPSQRTYVDRKTLRQRTDADPQDVALLQKYCEGFGIRVVESHWRSVVIGGQIGRLIEAFGATVASFADDGGRHVRHRTGSLHAPSAIAEIVCGIFGLHQWPRARKIGSLQRHLTPLSAGEIARRYDFPDADGTGQTVAIVQFRGEFKPADFDLCMQAQNVARSRPIVKRVDNASLHHEFDTTKDLEAALDAQVIGALAPGARIAIYDAPDDERGFLDAIRTAIFDAEYEPSVLSISYGWPEQLWTPAALAILNDLFTAAALAGVSVFCSSGDNGAELDYDGKPHVLAPAASPFAHACGATVLSDGDPGEAGWEKTGGGFSRHFDLPPWQVSATDGVAQASPATGRGVPDFAAQQLPGYCVYLDGVELAMGGTSAIAPMWAALTARLNQSLGAPIGFFAPLLYANSNGAMNEITAGGNDYFQARAGWNPCTGLGVPRGKAIEATLRGNAPAP